MSSIGTKIDNLNHQEIIDLLKGLLNRCFGKAGLIEGTNANTLKTATTVAYSINGVAGSFAATDNLAMTACAVQPVSTYCKYLVSTLIGGSTVTTTKGNNAATAALALVPELPANSAPLGYFQILTDATTTFTSGTTDLGAAGITETYVDLSSVVTA